MSRNKLPKRQAGYSKKEIENIIKTEAAKTPEERAADSEAFKKALESIEWVQTTFILKKQPMNKQRLPDGTIMEITDDKYYPVRRWLPGQDYEGLRALDRDTNVRKTFDGFTFDYEYYTTENAYAYLIARGFVDAVAMLFPDIEVTDAIRHTIKLCKKES